MLASRQRKASNEVPVETFFIRSLLCDRLRVMEQRMNAHKLLLMKTRLTLQQYLTRTYGSLPLQCIVQTPGRPVC